MILRFLGVLFTAGVILALCGAIAFAYVVWDLSQDLPDYKVLKDYKPPVMTRVHATDGRLVAEYATERRLYLPIGSIPDKIVQAVMSAEDKNFYQHGGIDFSGIARAVVVNIQNLRRNRRPVGASTITQQVAKNFLLTNDVTIERKAKEALLALRIERAFTKDQILELYLNDIYLGLGAYGMAAAALVYFDKSVHELTLSEMAYLAALPKAPNNYHPFRQTERAIERRNWVLDRMAINGFISEEEAATAKSDPLRVIPRSRGAQIFAADYFAEEVRREIANRYGEKALYEGGLSVRTTLDLELQKMARNALVRGLVGYDQRKGWRGPVTNISVSGDWGEAISEVEMLNDVEPWRLGVVLQVSESEAAIGLRPQRLPSRRLSDARETAIITLDDVKWAVWASGERRGRDITAVSQVLSVGDVAYFEPVEGENPGWKLRQVPEVGGAIVAMDPHTGRVKAMVGGFSYDQSEFNRATQARRQPGSSFKPFIYAAALDNGYTPSSVVMDAPIAIDQGPGLEVWTPQNYGGKFYGPSTLRRGIELSRNVMTVRLARDMGMPLIVEYARRFGIYENLQPVLSMSLGAGETTVLRMAGAYSILANGGKKVEPTLIDRIQDRYGRTIYKHDPRTCNNCNGTWQGQDEPELVDERSRVLDAFTAYQMTSMLEGVVQRGTATRVRDVGKPLAGKTGTTNDEKDAWFVGYSPDLVVGVFIGFDQPKPMGRGSTGGQLAAPVFKDFMVDALADTPAVPFRVPPGIRLVRINADNGLRARPGDAKVILEAFKPGTSPPDDYSIIGMTDGYGRTLTVSPEADAAVTSGTGGLY